MKYLEIYDINSLMYEEFLLYFCIKDNNFNLFNYIYFPG